MVHLTLTIALSHAISFLTKPLAGTVATKTIDLLRQQLELKLREEFASTWFPEQPQRGSNMRCMTLSPARLPPRALLAACFAARFPWSQWMEALGKVEFVLYIDPGSVSVLRRGDKAHRIVWSSSTHSGAYDAKHDDDDIEEVLDIINRKVIVSDAWLSPTQPTFPGAQVGPIVPPAATRLDTAFIKSRSASRRSNSSGSDDGAYDSDSFSAPPSLVESASISSVSSRAASPAPGSSSRSSGKYVPPARRGAATGTKPASRPSPRQQGPPARASSGSGSSNDESWRTQREESVVVDASKAKLTVYAGKTTVMSGGVMLSAMARR